MAGYGFEDLKPNNRTICQNCRDWVRDTTFHPLWPDKQSHWGKCLSAKPRHNCRYFYHTCKRFMRKEDYNDEKQDQHANNDQ